MGRAVEKKFLWHSLPAIRYAVMSLIFNMAYEVKFDYDESRHKQVYGAATQT
jgi:hypothetical protein